MPLNVPSSAAPPGTSAAPAAGTSTPAMCLATILYLFRHPRSTSAASASKLRARLRPPVLLSVLAATVSLTSALLALAVLAASPSDLRPNRPFVATPPGMRPCKNALIFTGARQGSTWFIDSLERCRYSTRSQDGTHFSDDVFRKTELWKHFGEAQHGKEMGADDALRYISRNTSVKIFPSVFWRRRKEVADILQRRHEINITVMVLRRDVEAAWQSWSKAEVTQVWNGAVKEDTAPINETYHRYFVESRARYDLAVDGLMRRLRIPHDIFDYDLVKRMPIIVARQNGCFIENCNFRREQVDSSGAATAAAPVEVPYQVPSIDQAADGEYFNDGSD